jgi:two-component system, chemotaxis family, sensor kinase CheA
MAGTMDQLTRIFLQEATDQLESLESVLLDLEENYSSRELQDYFLRLAHSLKGASGTAGFTLLADLAHELENLLGTLQLGQITPGPDYFDMMYRGLEAMRRHLDSIAAGKEDSQELEAVCRDLAEWFKSIGKEKEDDTSGKKQESSDFSLGEYDLLRIKMLPKQNKILYRIDIGFKPDTNDHENAAVAIFQKLRESGDVIKSIPGEGMLASIAENNRMALLFASTQAESDISPKLSQDYVNSVKIVKYQIEDKSSSSDSSSNDSFLNTFASEKTVRLEMEVLDELLRLVGELMLNRARFESIAGDYLVRLGDQELGSEIAETAENLGHLTSDLQSGIMRARMVPISRLFRMMKRRVRDVSRKLDTQVRLIGHGERTELDKKLFDLLAEELTDLIGIVVATVCDQSAVEPVELSVKAERKGNHVLLRFSGDGSPPGEEEFSEISQKVSDCGGRFSISESAGRFSLFVSLPITLAIVPVMMVEAASEIYAFPLETVKETLRLNLSELATVEGKEIIEIRGEALSLLNIGTALDIEQSDEGERKFVVVVENGDEPIGIVVDRLIGKRDVVIKPLGSHFAGIKHISGSTILGDGKVALIINSETMIGEAKGLAA